MTTTKSKYYEFNERIQFLLNNGFKSPLDLAEAINVNVVTVKRWLSEQNMPTIRNNKIIDGLAKSNIRSDWFYFGKGEPYIDPNKKIINNQSDNNVTRRYEKIRDFFGIKSWADFATEFEFNSNSLYAYRTGKISSPQKFLDTLNDVGINPIWLVSGKGNMLLSGDSADEGEYYETVVEEPKITATTKKKKASKKTTTTMKKVATKKTAVKKVNEESEEVLAPKVTQKPVIAEIPQIEEEVIVSPKVVKPQATKPNVVAKSNAESGVPFYTLNIFSAAKDSFDEVMDNPTFYANILPLNDCDASFTVYGDSMSPKINQGDIVFVKKIANIDSILWGESYFIVTSSEANSIITIKNIHPHSDENKVILRAINSKFAGDTIIEKQHILNIYSIKGILQMNQF